MKVLIITYYWPPAGGSGVQRWLKFVKYLRDFEIEPVIYTVANPNYAVEDKSLENEIEGDIEILRQPIWEPNDLLSIFNNNQKQTSAGFLNPNPSFLEKKIQYIRANYFIPDARKFWIKPSVDYLSNYLKTNKIDAIITTGPPHSLHLIGMQLQKKFSIRWISDFRDPWTEIDYFHKLPLTEKSRNKHTQLEQEVLESSDAVIVVGKTMKENFDKWNKNIHVITNGFDNDGVIITGQLDDKFSFTHVGMMNADRNPELLWKVFADLARDNPDLKKDLQINLIGKVAPEVLKNIENKGLKNNLVLTSYISHKEVLQHQNSAQILLLVVNNVPSAKGIITGKIFEYLQAKRPILAIAPTNGDLAELISKTQSGVTIGYKDEDKLKETILTYYNRFKNKDLKIKSINIDQFHRKNLTRQLAGLLKNS